MTIKNRTLLVDGGSPRQNAAVSEILARRFDDFDHFNETIRDWNLDFRQIDRGAFEASVLQRQDDRIGVGYAEFTRALEQKGSPPKDVWTFAVPALGCAPFEWRKHRMTGNRIAAFRPGSELDAVSLPGFRIFTVSVPEESLDGPPASEVVVVETKRIQLLRHRLADFLRQPTDPGDLVVNALNSCLGSGNPAETHRSPGRDQILSRVEVFLTAHPREPVSVADLTGAFGVNERTLRRAFRDRFGLSPKAYLIARRLNGARRELAATSPWTARVADIARSWGFPHAGQFSVRYKAQFGESPSVTLSRLPG